LKSKNILFFTYHVKNLIFLFNLIIKKTFKIYSGHCKQLAPEYEKAAEILMKNDPPFSLAKVDATEQKKLAEKYAI
jgi:hypothetical protein